MITETGLPPVQYKWDNFVTAIFPLVKEKTSDKTSDKIIGIILANPNITIAELSEMVEITKRSIERNLQKLQKEERIKRIGSKKGGHWEIIE